MEFFIVGKIHSGILSLLALNWYEEKSNQIANWCNADDRIDDKQGT